jgi:pyruvate formate lyase activating enzyme
MKAAYFEGISREGAGNASGAESFGGAEKSITCTLCPHRCTLKNGKSGICGVRMNSEGRMTLPFYGALSSIAIDPIEKKPLHHFYPGSRILSVGFVGCTMRCPFCQNYSISQGTGAVIERIDPDYLIDMAVEKNSFGIAYTYSEPTVHFEFVLETARRARARGLKNVLVTNGLLNPEPASELLEFIDAANVDLKSFNDSFYRKDLGGVLSTVKDFIALYSKRTELEVTTLVLPGKNDSEAEIAEASSFIASINRDIPYHLSCYYPTYTYTIPPTSPQKVESLARVARRSLRYVYTGNIHSGESNTYCPDCGTLLIRRIGYETTVVGLGSSRCVSCGSKIPIIA